MESSVPVYAPPRGKPLGTNITWKIGSAVVIPLLNLISKHDWRGVKNIPQSGPMIAICNHISYVDPLVFAHFLYGNGRAVRFLGKASLFKVPILGWILRHGEQVPVEREVQGASTEALAHAISFLKSGHCIGIYPEGTLTRDPLIWPMAAKTGLARLAVTSKVPVIPCAQWGAQEILEPYGKWPKFFPRTKVVVVAGKALDFSPWYGKEGDLEAMLAASAYAMAAITSLLEGIRGESAPGTIFDPRSSGLPRTGNFKKKRAK